MANAHHPDQREVGPGLERQSMAAVIQLLDGVRCGGVHGRDDASWATCLEHWERVPGPLLVAAPLGHCAAWASTLGPCRKIAAHDIDLPAYRPGGDPPRPGVHPLVRADLPGRVC